MHYLTLVLVRADIEDIQGAVKNVFAEYDPSAPGDYPRYDWWCIGGIWQGVLPGSRERKKSTPGTLPEPRKLPVNTCLASRVPRFVVPHALVTPDGAWHSPFYGPYKGQLSRWPKSARTILRKHADCIAVAANCHV